LQIKELLSQKVAHENMRSNTKPKRATSEAVKTKEQGESHSFQSPEAERLYPNKRSDRDLKDAAPPPKRSKPTAQNFLQIGAKKAKETRSARNAARVGFLRSQKNKLSHTGSGVPFSQVIRLKYVKGFTEAVRTPCNLDDLK
jgi:chromosome transmission fidelity protein 18